jgi:acyl transferase domain-containing protein
VTGEPIAIIGISCRLPGGVRDLASAWDMLVAGRDTIGPIPPDRMDAAQYHDATPGTPGRINATVGAYLDDIAQFDAAFFGIAPRDAERIDPQHRLMLELAWEALEDAGQDIAALQGTSAGVYIGLWHSDFEHRLQAEAETMDLPAMLGTGRYGASGRLSYALDLRGPSLTVDTACSSSLAAVHLAVGALRARQCRLALVGAANVILRPHLAIAYNSVRVMAADGRCKFADAAADGFVRGEAAGMLALKTLADAQADGDRIHAVIRGSAIGNDGRASGSLGRPSRPGQAAILRAACDDAGISPADIGYVEAHGTGTRAGDPVELGALSDVMGQGRPPDRPLLVGSIKTNIGHAEAAAGLAGLIKAALAVRAGEIPGNLHFHTPHPSIPWAEMNLRIVAGTTPFPPPARPGPRLAGISSYGIAGANAHVVIAAPPDPPAVPSAPPRPGALLLPLSARSQAALRALAASYADALATGAPASDICRAAATRRTALSHRAAFAAADPATLADALRRFAAGDTTAAVAEGIVRSDTPPAVAFVMPGHGGQFIGMGRDLLAGNAAFRAALLQCDAAAHPITGWSLIERLTSDTLATDELNLDRVDVAQPLLCALSIAYAAALRTWGVHPAAVIGHSMGEVAAAAVAGVLDIPQAMRVICRRSALMQPATGQGAMALVDLPEADTRARLAGRDGQVVIAAINGPRTTVISGDLAPLRAVAEALAAEGVFVREVKMRVAAHSHHMDAPAAALGADLAGLTPASRTLPIYSTVQGALLPGAAFGASYWARNMRQPVQFAAAARAIAADGLRCFVELGAHPLLVGALREIAPDATIIGCGRRDHPGAPDLLAVLGALWVAGCTPDWRQVMPAGNWVGLPLYPWQRERHWAEAAALRPAAAAAAPRIRLDDAQRSWLHRFDWTQAEATGPARRGRWLVLGTASRAAPLAAALGGAMVRTMAALAASLERGEPGITNLAVLVEDRADAAFLPLRILQTVIRSGTTPRLWFITQGGQAVTPDERVSVDLAACWGAARAVAEEHPDLWGGLADASPGDDAALARHLLAQDDDDQVALRAGRRFVPRLTQSAAPAMPYAWRQDGAYLITGGLGAIGLEIARRAALSGARRLVLLGRTKLPPRAQWGDYPATGPMAGRIAAIRALEALGVAVHTASVDVADEAGLRAFLELYRSQGWPPIRGVIHAAVELVPMLSESAGEDDFARALAAKLRGAQLLDRLLPELDLFALFSSFTAFLPHPGIAAYAAANAGLDALAQDRRARGQPAVSIAWGFWDETGLAAGTHMAQDMARIGLLTLPPAPAADLFAVLCGGDAPYHAVMRADWAAFQRARASRPQPIFSRLLPVADQSISLAARLAAAAPPARRPLLETLVRQEVGRVLKLAPQRLDDQGVLGEMGLNSLLAIELRNRLEAATGAPLPATLAWNHPTIVAIAAYLGRTFAPQDATAAPAGPVPPHPAPRPDIDSMSDDEALQLLMGAAE